VTDAGYIFAGYGLTAAIIGTYAAWVIRRRRAIGRLLSQEER
jgi:hypothetical protein